MIVASLIGPAASRYPASKRQCTLSRSGHIQYNEVRSQSKGKIDGDSKKRDYGPDLYVVVLEVAGRCQAEGAKLHHQLPPPAALSLSFPPLYFEDASQNARGYCGILHLYQHIRVLAHVTFLDPLLSSSHFPRNRRGNT